MTEKEQQTELFNKVWEKSFKDVFERDRPNLVLSVIGDTKLHLPVAWSRPALKDAITETAKQADGCWVLCESSVEKSSLTMMLEEISKDIAIFQDKPETAKKSLINTESTLQYLNETVFGEKNNDEPNQKEANKDDTTDGETSKEEPKEKIEIEAQDDPAKIDQQIKSEFLLFPIETELEKLKPPKDPPPADSPLSKSASSLEMLNNLGLKVGTSHYDNDPKLSLGSTKFLSIHQDIEAIEKQTGQQRVKTKEKSKSALVPENDDESRQNSGEPLKEPNSEAVLQMQSTDNQFEDKTQEKENSKSRAQKQTSESTLVPGNDDESKIHSGEPLKEPNSEAVLQMQPTDNQFEVLADHGQSNAGNGASTSSSRSSSISSDGNSTNSSVPGTSYPQVSLDWEAWEASVKTVNNSVSVVKTKNDDSVVADALRQDADFDKKTIMNILLELQIFLKKQTIDLNIIKEKIDLPVISILVEGDLETIEQISNLLEEDIPVLIIKGTGKAADYLSTVLFENGNVKLNMAQWFGTQFLRNKDNVDRLKKLTKQIRRRKWLLSSFDLSQPAQLMADIISKTVCSGWLPSCVTTDDFDLNEDFPDLFLDLMYQYLQFLGKRDSPDQKLILLCAWESRKTELCQVLLDDGTTFSRKGIEDIFLRSQPEIKTLGEQTYTKLLRDLFDREKKAMSLCQDMVGYSRDLTQTDENAEEPDDDSTLLLSTILKDAPELTDISWQRSSNQLMTALIVSSFAESQSHLKEDGKDKITAENYRQLAKKFENRAVQMLDKLYEEYAYKDSEQINKKSVDINDAIDYLLQHPISSLSIHSCPLEFAYYTERYEFISHTCSQTFLYRDWESTENAESYFNKIKLSSKWKFVINYIFFILALICFSGFFLSDIHSPDQRVSPWLVCYTIWVCADLIEEVYTELMIDKWRGLEHSFMFRFRHWIGDFWNILDILSYVLFFVALLVHYLKPSTSFTIARRLYTAALSITYVRVLRVLLVSKAIGPKIIMIGLMLKDLLRFIPIFLIFCVGAGIAYHGNIFINDSQLLSGEWDTWRIWKVMEIPFWQIFGETPLDSFESNNLVYCKELSVNGTATNCDTVDWIVPLVAALYMLVSNLLLVNIVIAMFSNTFTHVQTNSEKFWNYYMLSLITEYRTRIPVPLNLVYRIWRFGKAVFTCCYPIPDEYIDKEGAIEIERQLAYYQKKFAAECVNIKKQSDQANQ